VRTDAIGGELADLPVAVLGVANADHAAPGLEVVLAGEQMAAVRRESAVAVEVTPRGGVDGAERLPRSMSITTAKAPGRRAKTTQWAGAGRNAAP